MLARVMQQSVAELNKTTTTNTFTAMTLIEDFMTLLVAIALLIVAGVVLG
jgi:hypothetical protein